MSVATIGRVESLHGNESLHDNDGHAEDLSESSRLLFFNLQGNFWASLGPRLTLTCDRVGALTTRLRARSRKWCECGKTWFKQWRICRIIRTKFPGCQTELFLTILLGVFTLIINAALLGAVVDRNKWHPKTGLGLVTQSKCGTVQRGSQFAHAMINILSTGLVGQSNYCMQLLASPTRRDIEKAHKKRQWVDIGIPSFRNIWKRHISVTRTFVWLLLAASSVPLHLVWNSVLILSPIAYQYNQLTVTDAFVKGAPIESPYVGLRYSEEQGGHWPDNLRILQEDLRSYQRLETNQCLKEYARGFVQNRGDVVVVVEQQFEAVVKNVAVPVLGSAEAGKGSWPYKWLCPEDINESFDCYDQIMGNQSHSGLKWRLPNYDKAEVKYCLSKIMPEMCKLEYGGKMLITVIVANSVKVGCFIFTLWFVRRHTGAGPSGNRPNQPTKLLITSDDAIESFLEDPDLETLGMSTVEKRDFQHGIWDLRWIPINPMVWRERTSCSSFRAIGVTRWLFSSIFHLLFPLIPGCYLLAQMFWLKRDLRMSRTVIKELGIGKPSALFLFGINNNAWKDEAVAGDVVLANLPQLVLSIAYYLWSSHLTAMVAAVEFDQYAARKNLDDSLGDVDKAKDSSGGGQWKRAWTRFSHVSKEAASSKQGLRVASPIEGSAQRSSRFFTMPFRYLIPNTILWIGLHFIASQAMFLARVDLLDHWEQRYPGSISQVGYSILGLILFVAISSLVFCYTMWISLRRMPNRMPLSATCSGALSAACHPKDMSIRHHEREVHWGVEVDEDDSSLELLEGAEKRIQRCTFTSMDAFYPRANTYYA